MRLELVEWQSVTLPRLPDATVDALLTLEGRPLSVAAAPARQQVLTAGATVGVVRAPGLEVLIRPKVGIRNLFTLMGVSTGNERWFRDTFGYAEEPDLLVGTVRLFAHAVEAALAGGLRRDYRPEEDRLIAPRGRIDFPSQFRRPGLVSPIACRFDEHTADIPLNRLIAAALHVALAVPVLPVADRRLLHHDLAQFDAVLPVEPSGWFERWTPTRLDRHWLPAATLADLILRRLTVADRAGEATAVTFLLDMNQLFERFVTEGLRRALEGRLEVRDQVDQTLDVGRKLWMRPDLVFYRDGRPVFVADCKYKIAKDGQGRIADYYQALAYATALGLQEAALIYHADADVVADPRPATVRHGGVRLHTWPVDLTGELGDIQLELGRVADWCNGTLGAPTLPFMRPEVAGVPNRALPRRDIQRSTPT